MLCKPIIAAPELSVLKRSRYITAIVFFLILLISLSSNALTQEAIVVRGQLFDDYGRLILSWPANVPKIDIRLSNKRMALHFEQSVTLDVAVLRANLKAYIRNAHLSENGKELTLELKKPVTYRTARVGRNFQLDLAQPGEEVFKNEGVSTAESSTLAQAPTERTANADTQGNSRKIRLRSGNHEGYSRLAIDWPGVEFSLRYEKNKALVTFSKSGELDPRYSLPMRLLNVASRSLRDGKLLLELDLAPNVTVSAFRNGNTVVFDLTDEKKISPKPSGIQEAASKTLIKPEFDATKGPLSVPAFAGVSGGSSTSVNGDENVAATAHATKIVRADVSALSTGNSTTLKFSFSEVTGLALFKMDGSLWMIFDRPSEIDITNLKKASASFDSLSLIRNAHATVFRVRNSEEFKSVQVKKEKGDKGNSWQITFDVDGAFYPTKVIEQKRESLADGGTSLLLQTVSARSVISLNNPKTGTPFSVIPLSDVGIGVLEGATWPDFQILPSFQGIVVASTSERTKVRVLPNGVVVTTEGSVGSPPSPIVPKLMLETEPPALDDLVETTASSAATGELRATESFFDLPKWRQGGEASFATDQSKLLDELNRAIERSKPQARLMLAKFHFAHGRYPETLEDLALLDKLADDGDRQVLALRGAADALLDRYQESLANLNRSELANVPEASLFRGYIAGRERDWPRAADVFKGALPSLDNYPKRARMLLRRVAAEALIRNGNLEEAKPFLDSIAKDMPNTEDSAYYEYLLGLQQSLAGDAESAIKTWNALANTSINEVRARSQFDLTELQLKEKKLDPLQAIRQLEALRFAWRGGDFEFDLLEKLGSLYIEADQPRKGLVTLQQAATNFPKNPKAASIAVKMSDTFYNLYLGGRADKLSPLTALALYDEFRELTPSGPAGDQMITALADRLVKVDLLEGAGKLLENQIAKRLTGLEKAKVGTRLAAIRLLDDKPDLALKAIKDSEVVDIPADTIAQRRRLQSRALFETGDILKSIALIHNDRSLDGLKLKADLAWRVREWPAAAAALDDLISAELGKIHGKNSSEQSTTKLEDDPATVLAGTVHTKEAQAREEEAFNGIVAPLVLKYAVALSLANDRSGLRLLAKARGEQMAKSAYATAFATLTGPNSKLTESIEAAMKSVDQLGAFVDDYRKRLKQQILGTTAVESDSSL